MVDAANGERDLASLVVPDIGQLIKTGDQWEPYQLIDGGGAVVAPVAAYLAELQAASCAASTLRSYGMDLLRWLRFLAAVEVPWDRATQVEARDFARWMQITDKPIRVHWRRRGDEGSLASAGQGASSYGLPAGTPNSVTGKPTPGRKYAASTRAHAETVLRSFYDFHLEAGRGPIINPFPLDRSRRAGRANAHHNPLDPFKHERQGRYRPRTPKRIPRRIPDEKFDELFAALKWNRDRALLAFWVSTGARAEELLGADQHDADPGQQLISVTRKGSREVQQLPASPDAFVWLRLYQEEIWRKGVPRGRNRPLWWTLRRPWRPLNYYAARAMFARANDVLGANWTLHDLRHTAAYRMVRDPGLPLTDVQWVLGHRHLSTTQLYTTASRDEVITSVLEHHERQAKQDRTQATPPPASGYNPDSLNILFGPLS
ncbi:tyrosine-type recombinase/integrase [Nonomuraea sp. NPDC046802]|uniref:tyrosine-type recombinase/integrase n=1 Tax=Nonomuraea sp. NPDC046802 TaxID=3154919 RepID=UPI0033F78953